MSDSMLSIFGWRSLLIHGDPCVLDRWLWLRQVLQGGPARTFDAGCGNGAFSIYAALRGNDVLAASFSEEEQRDARRRADRLAIAGVEFRVLDLRELASVQPSLGQFEQVICLETIEHLSDDASLLRSLSQLLAPGGRLLLTTPFDRHRPLYGEEREPSPTEDGSHVRYGYSQERLRELVEDAGLEVEREDFVSGIVSQKLTDLMRWLTPRVGLATAWAVLLPLRSLVAFDRPLTKLLRYPHLCVAVRAAKPSVAA